MRLGGFGAFGGALLQTHGFERFAALNGVGNRDTRTRDKPGAIIRIGDISLGAKLRSLEL